MLKEACAVSALVAAALVPSMTSQAAQADQKIRPAVTPVSIADCASGRAPKCKWLEEGNKRCFYCRGKKGSGYKKQYCEKKQQSKAPDEGPTELNCKFTTEQITGQPTKFCKTCTNAKTGKVVSRECST